MVVEADYASFIFSVFNQEATFRYTVAIFLAVFCLVYVLSGGYKAAVLTDERQLPLAYVSLILVILFTLMLTFENGFTSVFWWLNFLLIFLFLLMFWRKGGFNTLRSGKDRTIFIPIFGLAVVAVASFLSFLINQKATQPNELTSLSLFGTPLAQGPILLFSLFLANFFWMLVDISTWQRIASVSTDTSEPDIKERLKPIRKGLEKIMWESPISWGLGTIFGMSLRYSGVFNNVDQASSNISIFVSGLALGQLQSSLFGLASFVFLPLFFIAVIAIMLSTIDSYLSAITFTAMYDLPPYRDKLHQRLDEISTQTIALSSKFLNAARLYTVAITVIAVSLYFYLSILTEGYIVTYLYVFYSAQLSLLPSVVHALIGKRLNKYAALTSLIFGFTVSVCTGVKVSTMEAEYSVLTPLLCLSSAFASYYLVCLLKKEG